MTNEDIFEFVSKSDLAVIGTVSPEGKPQSALVGIAVTRDLEIIFDTLNTTRKYRNLSAISRCSFAVGWQGETTLQYEGEAREPSGSELVRYKEVYFKKWPTCIPHELWPEIAYFVVRPKWIRYSDYNHTPPLIQEFSF
jgi:Pyridoxamine 5'-phosphate oxidase